MGARELLRKLLARRALYRVSRNLHQSALAGLGVLNHQDCHSSGEEHFLMRELRRLVDDPRPVVFDVGANTGAYAELVLDAIPGARVYAFEPHPRTHAALRSRLGERARCFELALGAQVGTLDLYDYADKDGSSHATSYREVIEELRGRESVHHTVRVSTVDEQVEALGVDRIHLLKIDTEGHELAVLDGAQRTIAAGRVDVVQFEFNEMNVVSRSFLRDFLHRLPGYEFFRLLPDGLAPMGPYRAVTWEIFAFQNIVAVAPRENRRR